MASSNTWTSLFEYAYIDPPFWSPDGRFIVFDTGGKLKKLDIAGGLPQTLADLRGLTEGGIATARADEGVLSARLASAELAVRREVAADSVDGDSRPSGTSAGCDA